MLSLLVAWVFMLLHASSASGNHRQGKRFRPRVDKPQPVATQPALRGVVQTFRQLQSQGEIESTPAACMADRASLPAAWQPSADLQASLSAVSSSAALDLQAMAAARRAYEEVTGMVLKPGALEELKTDAFEAIINGAFAGSNEVDIQAQALDLGRDIWLELAGPYLEDGKDVFCDELSSGSLSELTHYGDYIQKQAPPNSSVDGAQEVLLNLTKKAVADCANLSDLLGFDPKERLSSYPDLKIASKESQIEQVYDMVLQGIDLVGLAALPSLEMPDGAIEYAASLWNWISLYPFPSAMQVGKQSEIFQQNSYIVTHAMYLPTGYQRYSVELRDAWNLVGYLRANFYSAVEYGSLDLVAEFVDIFRQLNCTIENDAQTRDGTVWMLELYEAANKTWAKVKQPIMDESQDMYNVMHQAWTAYVGLSGRIFEEPLKGSYGAVSRQVMRLAAKQLSQR